MTSLKTGKEKICHSARKLFVEKGYHHTRIPDIVKDANVSTGALYHHFPSKEALALHLHRETVTELERRFELSVKKEDDFAGKVHAFVRMMFEWTDQDPVEVMYLLKGEMGGFGKPRLSICSEEGVRLVGEIISAGFSRKELATCNYYIASAFISGTIIRMISFKEDDFFSSPLADMADETARYIVQGLVIPCAGNSSPAASQVDDSP